MIALRRWRLLVLQFRAIAGLAYAMGVLVQKFHRDTWREFVRAAAVIWSIGK